MDGSPKGQTDPLEIPTTQSPELFYYLGKSHYDQQVSNTSLSSKHSPEIWQ